MVKYFEIEQQQQKQQQQSLSNNTDHHDDDVVTNHDDTNHSDQHNNQLNDNDTTDHKQREDNDDAVRSLRNAFSLMTSIASHINTMKKKHEHAVRVQEIQSLLIGWQGEDLTTYGELVAEATFKLFGNKTFRHLFLFDKMLLVVKKKDDSLFTYKAHILVSLFTNKTKTKNNDDDD